MGLRRLYCKLLLAASAAVSASVQQRLSPAACESFQQSVAAAVDNSLRLYRQRLQQAQQQLLQRELGGAAQGQDDNSSSSTSSAQKQQEQCGTEAATQDVGSGVAADTAAGSCGADYTDGSGVQQLEGSTRAAGGDGGVDAAVLTMQQLVALLAKRDAQPEDQQEWQPNDR
jgi:hypothetical protein